MEHKLKISIITRNFNFIPFFGLVTIWCIVSYFELIDSIFLPSPSSVSSSFFHLFTNNFILEHLAPSVVRVVSAFLISTLIAFPLGVLCSQYVWAERLIEPLLAFTRYLPIPAFVPLCILWFGIFDTQKVAVITLGVVFQLTLLFAFNTASVPQELIESGKTFGLSHFQIVCRVVIPWSMPANWDDMRVSAGWAWSYLVLAELVAGNRGIGYFIIQSQRYLETDRVFAGILFVGLLGLLTDISFRLVGSRLFQWK